MRVAADMARELKGRRLGAVLADPPWRFQWNRKDRTGAPAIVPSWALSVEEMADSPIAGYVDEVAHCRLWAPNAPLPAGLEVLRSWRFERKTNLIWHEFRKDGGSDGRGVGLCCRNVTELNDMPRKQRLRAIVPWLDRPGSHSKPRIGACVQDITEGDAPLIGGSPRNGLSRRPRPVGCSRAPSSCGAFSARPPARPAWNCVRVQAGAPGAALSGAAARALGNGWRRRQPGAACGSQALGVVDREWRGGLTWSPKNRPGGGTERRTGARRRVRAGRLGSALDGACQRAGERPAAMGRNRVEDKLKNAYNSC